MKDFYFTILNMVFSSNIIKKKRLNKSYATKYYFENEAVKEN